MHSMSEVNAAVREIAERMLTDYDSAHPLLGEKLFKESHADLLDALGEQLAEHRIRTMFRDELRLGTRQRGSGDQLSLPGVGDIDRTITIPDGEGGHRYKLTAKATADELEQDEELLVGNVQGAQASLQRAQLRNATLIPVMREHGYATAGEAIQHIMRGAA